MHRRAALVATVVSGLVACGDDAARPVGAAPPRLVERVVAARRPTPRVPPLLVLLHGIGADENDLLSLSGHLDARLMVVSLRAPRAYHGGYAWFDLTWGTDGSVAANVAQARETLADLVRWIAVAPDRLGADPTRVYLLGFSQGAMMSLGVLRTAPERLAGVIALSGRYGEDLFEEPAPANAMARVPLFVGHGTQDDLLPIDNGRAIRAAFEPLMRDFTYREYPVAHGIAPQELTDVAKWLTMHLDR
jgi:phospholipase/carboxylesterase